MFDIPTRRKLSIFVFNNAVKFPFAVHIFNLIRNLFHFIISFIVTLASATEQHKNFINASCDHVLLDQDDPFTLVLERFREEKEHISDIPSVNSSMNRRVYELLSSVRKIREEIPNN